MTKWWLTAGTLSVFIFILSCASQEKDNSVPSLNPVVQDSSSVQQQENPAGVNETAAVAVPQLTYAEKQGKRLYEHYCAVCHGKQGQGDGFNAYNLNPHPRDFTDKNYMANLSQTWLVEVVRQGGRGVKRSVLMPSYEKTLSSKQIRNIVAYVKHFSQ